MTVRMLLAVTVLATLVGCTQVTTPRPNVPEVAKSAPVKAGTATPARVVKLMQVRENLPPGYIGGHLSTGSSCRAVAEFKGDDFNIDEAAQAQSQFAHEYVETMKAAGYPAQALAIEIFDTVGADYKVEALLDKVIANLCKNGPGEAYVSVTWHVTDATSGALVFEGSSEGSARDSYVVGVEGFGLIVSSFGEATSNLLADPAFVALLQG